MQLGDGAFELRYRRADVRQFDDIGVWRGGQYGKLGEVILDLLVCTQLIGKARQDSTCQGDVARFDGDICGGSEGFYNGKKRIGGQGRGFVGEGIDDLRTGGHLELTLFFAERAQKLDMRR